MDNLDNVERYLERIANALERIADSMPPKKSGYQRMRENLSGSSQPIKVEDIDFEDPKMAEFLRKFSDELRKVDQ